ncbi:MAG: hypothetical protein ACRBBW_20480 [Cellvibrionaceae bacterium]
MKLKAGKRLQAIRELTGLTREEFAREYQIDLVRLKNLEQGKIRVAEDEYEKVGFSFPELSQWMMYEGPIDLEGLKESQNALCRLIGSKIEAGQLPKNYSGEISEAVK